MLKRLKISIQKPALLISFVKDKALRIIGYLLMMALLMATPIIITAIREPMSLLPEQQAFQSGIRNNFDNKDISITNGILNNPNNISSGFMIDQYYITMWETKAPINGVVLEFVETGINITMRFSGITQQIATYSYDEIYPNGTEFNNRNTVLNAAAISSALSKQPILVTSIVISDVFYLILEYLFIALFFTLMFKMTTMIPIPFSSSFKMSFYITSIWAVTTLILHLFDAREYAFIAFILVYINHIRTFRAIRVVRRVEVKKEDDKKDES